MLIRLQRYSSHSASWFAILAISAVLLLLLLSTLIVQEQEVQSIRTTLFLLEQAVDMRQTVVSFDESEWNRRLVRLNARAFFAQLERDKRIQSDVLYWLEQHQPAGMTLYLLSVAEDGLIYLDGSCASVIDYATMLKRIRESNLFEINKYTPLTHQSYGGYSFSLQIKRTNNAVHAKQVQR